MPGADCLFRRGLQGSDPGLLNVTEKTAMVMAKTPVRINGIVAGLLIPADSVLLNAAKRAGAARDAA